MEEDQNSYPARLLNINQASQFLGVSVSTLYGWVWQRRIPFVKIGRTVRFDIHDLERYIQACRRAEQQT